MRGAEKQQPGAPAESPVPGLVLLCGLITGIIGLALTLVTVVKGVYSAAALFLLASALVFGLMANAVFRA